MIWIRSAVFNLLFYVNLAILAIAGLPLMLFGRKAIFWLARQWGKNSLFLLKLICGTSVEFRGVERIPAGAFIIAPKHQSIWETFALLDYADDFSFILKRELTWIPFFGWYLIVAEQISINRSTGRTALAEATEKSAAITSQGRQIFIFPEGTRRPPGAQPAYKFGVAHLYQACNAPCLPVALNAGMFWPRRTFLRRPGKILVEFLDPIAPGLGKDEFFQQLQDRLESATGRLINESLAADPSLRSAVNPYFFSSAAPSKSEPSKSDV